MRKHYPFLIILCLLVWVDPSLAQTAELIPDSLQRELEKLPEDSSKVDLLNDWMWEMRLIDAPLGILLGERAAELANRIDYRYGLAVTLEMQGILYEAIGAYRQAAENYFKALDIWENFEDPYYLMSGYINLAVLFDRWGDTTKAVNYFRQVIELDSTIGDGTSTPIVYNNLATFYSDRGQEEKAKEYYLKALQGFRSLAAAGAPDYNSHIATIESNLGNYYQRSGQYEQAMGYYASSLEKARAGGYNRLQSSALLGMAKAELNQNELAAALAYADSSLSLAQKAGDIHREAFSYQALAVVYDSLGDHENALEATRQYLSLQQRINELAEQEVVREMEARYQNERQQFEIEKQRLELDRQEERLARQRTALFSAGGGLLLLLLLVGVIYNRYQLKQRANRELSEKNSIIEDERKRSDELLLNILPAETARELKQKGSAAAREFENVSVLFTDFEGFSLISQKLDAEQLVAALDHFFRAFDAIIEKHGLEKIKTIGDAYMAAGGIPVPDHAHAHARNVILAAIEIQSYLATTNAARSRNDQPLFRARIGIHSGPVIAGIVGSKKFAYDIWGDTVNTAARLEAAGQAGKINISGATYELIRNEFECEYRGKVEVKHKGEIEMYFVVVGK